MHAEEGGHEKQEDEARERKRMAEIIRREIDPAENQLKGGSRGQSGDKQDRSCEHPAYCHQPPK